MLYQPTCTICGTTEMNHEFMELYGEDVCPKCFDGYIEGSATEKAMNHLLNCKIKPSDYYATVNAEPYQNHFWKTETEIIIPKADCCVVIDGATQ